MADAPNLRPLSGEIMTAGGVGHKADGPASHEFVDAEYVTLDAPESLARDRPAPPEAAAPPGVSMLKRDARPEAGEGRRHGGPVFWLFGTTLILAAFWISGGHALVRHDGEIARTSLSGELRVEGVMTRLEGEGRSKALYVEGEIVNHGRQAARPGAIGIDVTDASGQVARYRMESRGAPIPPGSRQSFSSRLDAQHGVASVTVKIENEDFTR